MKIERDFSVTATVDLGLVTIKQETIAFPGKVIAPQTSLLAHNKIGVVLMPVPTKWSWRVEPDSFFSERNLAGLENNPENDVAQGGGQCRTNDSGHARSGLH